ncbi:MAG: tripartite tricarboxylate transporter TctB family protein [Candidatus Methylomirabilales bacterium]
MGDLIAAAFLLIVAALFYVQSLGLPPPPPALPDALGAAFSPQVLAILLGIMGVCLAARGILQVRRAGVARQGLLTRIREHHLIVKSLLLFFLFALLLKPFGFLISATAFLIAAQWVLSPRRWGHLPTIITVSVVCSLVVYFFFQKFLFVFLPEGTLF